MSELSIFNEIVTHQIEGVMFHDDCANLFDFMDLHGFKRQSEYHAMSEFAEMRGTNRYAINHLNSIPSGQGANRYREIIPSSWRNATRFDVNENDRKNKVREIFTAWRDWEKSTKDFYQLKFKELTELDAIASANKVNELIKKVDDELKEAERCWLKWNASGWDMSLMIDKQMAIHDKYEEKTEKEYKVKFC
jgi:hypothetical protein